MAWNYRRGACYLREMSVGKRWLVPAALLLATADAAAQPLDYVVVDPPRTRAGGGAHTIYLNRCAAGCTATVGDDDAARDTSSILGRNMTPATVTLEPFVWDQATWDAVVACTAARYAPWDIAVVTDEPTSGRYVEVMVAGVPAALGLAANTLGVAPLTSDCSPLPSALAFAFANAHAQGSTQLEELCTTVIHEAGHLFGLDHEFDCRDPMTYLPACGTKVFVNRSLPCGELMGERDCKCGATQNSFTHLTAAIGAGAAPAAPAVTVAVPAPDATVASRFSVFALVDSPRPIAEMALWINGRAWARLPGKTSTAPYELRTPAELPDGTLDLDVRTRDDLGNVSSVTLTVHKGAACVDASTCLAGQTCVAGGCRSPAGTTALGAACGVDEDCASKLCVQAAGAGVCSTPCYPAGAACGDGLTCRAADDEGFACLVTIDEGGCCSSNSRPGSALALAALAAALLARRRRGQGTPSMQHPTEQN